MGARNWGWRDVLPTFQAMTDDRDAPHGRNVRRAQYRAAVPRGSWPLYMRKLEEVARAVPSHANFYETD